MRTGQVFAQRFQLMRELGEGGMGQVWLAEQISPVRRQVALKLTKAGMCGRRGPAPRSQKWQATPINLSA
jgi:hypothetical protein